MDGVALITVNDPDRRNAVTTEISSGLRAAIDAAKVIQRCTPSWSPEQPWPCLRRRCLR
jgi:hypothetical protein